MDMADKFFKMEINTKVNTKKTSLMEKESTNGVMEIFILELLLMALDTEKESGNLWPLMVIYMRDNIFRIKNKVKASIYGVMAQYFKATLSRIKSIFLINFRDG
jgi:hypothetical protein